MLAATSKLKGQKDMEKYEIARRLHQCVDKIRATYKDDWKSKEMRVRQRSVAMYFIDKVRDLIVVIQAHFNCYKN